MNEFVAITPEYEEQIRETVIRDRRGRRTTVDGRPKLERKQASAFPEHAVILDAALPAASHSLTGATHCKATVCRWSMTDKKYVETSRQIEVWNHSETISHGIDTFGEAKLKDGHYWFFGDCEPMNEREDRP